MRWIMVLLISFPLFAQEVIDPQIHQEKKTVTFPGETPPKNSPVEKVVEEATPVEETKSPTFEEVKKTLTTAEHRTNSFGTAMIGYQYLATWIPWKKTLSYTQIWNTKWSTELEYSWSSVGVPAFTGLDVGSISEKKYSALFRYYPANSFHYIFGPYYNHITGNLGGNVINSAGAASFETNHVGLMLGLGNRWQWKPGITFGVDWIRLGVPLHSTKNDNDVAKYTSSGSTAHDLKKFTRIANSYPNIVLFGLSLGYTF